MARGVQIKYINTNIDGTVAVGFNVGKLPLPAGQSGEIIFGNLTSVQDQIKQLEDSLTVKQLVLMHLAITWLQANGGFGNINQVLNKEMQFDPRAAQILKIV